MNNQGQTLMYARGGRRRKALDVDLNDTPPNEDHDQAVGTLLSLSYGGQNVDHVQSPAVAPTPAGSSPPVPIDVEELDDDVIISSPRAFEQARNSSRRIPRRTSVIDVESEEVSGRVRNQRRRVNNQQPQLYVILEVEESVQLAPPSPPPPPPPEPTFNCPVCMGPLVEEVTTKCGHIFCKACIKAAIAAQPKCPTCRRKVTNGQLIRIYLPTTN